MSDRTTDVMKAVRAACANDGCSWGRQVTAEVEVGAFVVTLDAKSEVSSVRYLGDVIEPDPAERKALRCAALLVCGEGWND